MTTQDRITTLFTLVKKYNIAAAQRDHVICRDTEDDEQAYQFYMAEIVDIKKQLNELVK